MLVLLEIFLFSISRKNIRENEKKRPPRKALYIKIPEITIVMQDYN